jgi:hypothetical protein
MRHAQLVYSVHFRSPKQKQSFLGRFLSLGRGPKSPCFLQYLRRRGRERRVNRVRLNFKQRIIFLATYLVVSNTSFKYYANLNNILIHVVPSIHYYQNKYIPWTSFIWSWESHMQYCNMQTNR